MSFPVSVKVYGDYGINDLIHVFNSELIVNKKTGDVTRKLEKLKEIRGKLNPGAGIRSPR